MLLDSLVFYSDTSQNYSLYYHTYAIASLSGLANKLFMTWEMVHLSVQIMNLNKDKNTMTSKFMLWVWLSQAVSQRASMVTFLSHVFLWVLSQEKI